MLALGADFWPLKLARELDDAVLHIRLNEFDVAMAFVDVDYSSNVGKCPPISLRMIFG